MPINSSVPFSERRADNPTTKLYHSDMEKEQLLVEVAELYARGKYQHEIAAIYGLTTARVGQLLKDIQTRWEQAQIANFDLARREQLAKIDWVEREFAEAWEKSKNKRVTQTAQRTGGSGKKADGSDVNIIYDTRAVTKTEEVNGDPRYLQGVLDCISQRRKLLGLDEPTRIDFTEVGEFTDGRIERRLVELLRKAGATGTDDGVVEENRNEEGGQEAGQQSDEVLAIQSHPLLSGAFGDSGVGQDALRPESPATGEQDSHTVS